MAGGFGPRFALEAGFLILLAAAAGIADLRPLLIVAIVAAGWVLVSLLELVLWRAESRPAPIAYAVEPAAEPEPDPEPELEPLEPQEPLLEGEPEDYPLRADAGLEPSEEAEAYTTVLAEEDAAAPEAAAAERRE
jgi:hypothetical protein